MKLEVLSDEQIELLPELKQFKTDFLPGKEVSDEVVQKRLIEIVRAL